MKMLQCVAGEWQILSVDLVIAGDPGFAYVRRIRLITRRGRHDIAAVLSQDGQQSAATASSGQRGRA
jgi:hypothetical protein